MQAMGHPQLIFFWGLCAVLCPTVLIDVSLPCQENVPQPAASPSVLVLSFCCLPREVCRRLWPSRWVGSSSDCQEKQAGSLESPCKGKSQGCLNESSTLISQAAPHSRSKSGTASMLLILHRSRGIFFLGRVLWLFCVLKCLKLMFVRIKILLKASPYPSQALGELHTQEGKHCLRIPQPGKRKKTEMWRSAEPVEDPQLCQSSWLTHCVISMSWMRAKEVPVCPALCAPSRAPIPSWWYITECLS